MAIQAELADGTVLEFPDNTPDEVVRAKVKELIAKPKQSGSSVIIDDETGAPYKDRFIIGSASSPADQLARARALYGESALQDVDGRISFKNPETGRRTYVNPSGMDMGDIAGGLREIASVGASLPFNMSAVGIPAGAATGAAVGQGVDAIAASMARGRAQESGNPVPDVQSPIAAAQDFGKEAALGTLGGGLMKGVGLGLGKVINPTDARLVQAWRDLGMQPPSLASVSNGKAVARVESALGDTITGSGFIERGATAGRRGLETALADIAEQIGGRGVPTTVDELGVLAQRLAAQNRKAWQASSSQEADALFQSFGNNPASLTNTTKWIDDTASKLSPKAAAKFKTDAENIIKTELADSADGTLNVHTVRALRTKLGQLADDPMITSGSVDKGIYKKLSKAAKEDIRSALSPAQQQQFDAYNAAYSSQKEARDILESALFGSGDSTKIGSALLSPNLSANTARAMQEVLGPDEFNAIRAGVIRQLGTPRAGAHLAAGEASPATFSTLTGRGRGAYQPEVQDALLGADIDPVRVIAEGMDNAGKTVNTSRTASINEVLRLMRSPAQWTQGLAAFLDPVTSLAVPAGLGFAHTSPAVINALSSPAAQAMSRGVRAASPRIGLAGGLMAPASKE